MKMPFMNQQNLTEYMADPSVPLRNKITAYVLSRGFGEMLLCAIAIGVWVRWPETVSQFQSGYDKNAAAMQQAADTYRVTTDRLLQQIVEDRQVMIELARNQREATQTFENAVERLQHME